MSVKFETTGPPVTQQTVDAFEATLPGPLPSDYREFLVSQNGGSPEPNWWPPELNSGPGGVRALFGLGDVKSYNSLIGEREVFEGRIPDHLLAIGYDEGGGMVCVSLTGDEPGSVWFYDPEMEFDGDDGPLPAPSVRVCDSFTDLLDGLEPKPEYEEMMRRISAQDEGGPA